MKWLPIYSAPKDGDRFLAKSDDGWVAVIYWALELDEPEWLGDDFNPPERALIEWMPLPL